MPTVTCTPGGTSDNSYISEADAAAYFADTLREATWTGYGATRRQQALIQATADIERCGGTRVTAQSPRRSLFVGSAPYSDEQALHFPRGEDLDSDGNIVIPDDIAAAVCEQAYWLANKDANGAPLIDFDGLQAEGVRSFSMDGISAALTQTGIPHGIAPLAWERIRPYVKAQSSRTRVH